jgi:hypothetical protein
MKLNSIRLKDIDMLHLVFRGFRSHDGVGWLFRGQADSSWNLEPKAARKIYYLPDDRDLGRFHDWTAQAVAYSDLPSNFLESLALAQHHGLATRLLDWSMNPLVACYFACSERYEKDGAVYIYESPELHLASNINKDKLIERKGVFCFIPRAISPRILNQKGLFTVHCDAAEKIQVTQSIVDKERPNLFALIIPANLKLQILNHLDDYGIDRMFLFPDLDGLSAKINFRTERMRKPTP